MITDMNTYFEDEDEAADGPLTMTLCSQKDVPVVGK